MFGTSNTNDYIFDRDTVKAIQTDELTEIANLSIEELSNRVADYQRRSRELYLRSAAASQKLHERLSAVDSDELENIIERVPAAERHLVDRKGFVKPKPPTAVEKRKATIKAEAKTNPAIAAMLKDLGAKL